MIRRIFVRSLRTLRLSAFAGDLPVSLQTAQIVARSWMSASVSGAAHLPWRHRSAPAVAFVLSQRFHQVILTLASQPRAFSSPEKSSLWQKLQRCCWIRARAFSARTGLSAWELLSAPEFGECCSGAAQVVVAPALQHSGHGLDVAHFSRNIRSCTVRRTPVERRGRDIRD